MSERVGAQWGYCDLYLGGLLQAGWAWQGSAGFLAGDGFTD